MTQPSIIPQTFQRTAVTIVLDEDISRQGFEILTLHPLHPQAAYLASFRIPILVASEMVDQIRGQLGVVDARRLEDIAYSASGLYTSGRVVKSLGHSSEQITDEFPWGMFYVFLRPEGGLTRDVLVQMLGEEGVASLPVSQDSSLIAEKREEERQKRIATARAGRIGEERARGVPTGPRFPTRPGGRAPFTRAGRPFTGVPGPSTRPTPPTTSSGEAPSTSTVQPRRGLYHNVAGGQSTHIRPTRGTGHHYMPNPAAPEFVPTSQSAQPPAIPPSPTTGFGPPISTIRPRPGQQLSAPPPHRPGFIGTGFSTGVPPFPYYEPPVSAPGFPTAFSNIPPVQYPPTQPIPNIPPGPYPPPTQPISNIPPGPYPPPPPPPTFPPTQPSSSEYGPIGPPPPPPRQPSIPPPWGPPPPTPIQEQGLQGPQQGGQVQRRQGQGQRHGQGQRQQGGQQQRGPFD